MQQVFVCSVVPGKFPRKPSRTQSKGAKIWPLDAHFNRKNPGKPNIDVRGATIK